MHRREAVLHRQSIRARLSAGLERPGGTSTLSPASFGRQMAAQGRIGQGSRPFHPETERFLRDFGYFDEAPEHGV